jgi:decaprenylphospho-beta-D-ribofuranose 2-oxidase
MTARFVSFRGIERHPETLDSYSGLYSARALVLYPKSIAEVACIFDWATKRKRHVTVRAGGHSFDAQSLGDDLVMSMSRMDSIDLDVDTRRVTVGPGATWGKILAELEPHGLVPAVTVTTAHATAGGTLSGDCLSRFSPAYGKKGTWVEQFVLVTPDQRVVTCTRPPDPDNPASLEERLFLGVIGGLGYLGAVVSITYRLLWVGQTAKQIGVETGVRKLHSFTDLADELVQRVSEAHEAPDPRDPEKLDSVWSAVFAGPAGREDALVFSSFFTRRSLRHRMLLHRPGLALRVPFEWAMTVAPIPPMVWRLGFSRLYRDRQRFVDDLEGFTFFMDGNRTAKRIAHLFRWRPKTLQQTFVVPADPTTEAGKLAARNALVEWLHYGHRHLSTFELTPTLQDVLWLPKDLPFPLSATAGQGGFAVSYAFETSKDEVIEYGKVAFTEMADTLWTDFGGRVYLVKNVCATQHTLAEMYGDAAEAFFALKGDVDPGGILANAFLRRTFGGLLGAEAPV